MESNGRSHSSSARRGSDSGYCGHSSSPRNVTRGLRNCFVFLYQILVCLLYLTVLILGLISLGSFETKQVEVSSSANNSFRGYTCILFGTASKLGPDDFCTFVTAGQIAVDAIVLILILSTVTKTIYRKSGLANYCNDSVLQDWTLGTH